MFALTGAAIGGSVRLPVDVCVVVLSFCRPRTALRCDVCGAALLCEERTRPLIRGVPATLTLCGLDLFTSDGLVLERVTKTASSSASALAVEPDERGVVRVVPRATPELVSVHGARFCNAATRLLQRRPYKCLCLPADDDEPRDAHAHAHAYVCLACFLSLRRRRRLLLRWRERARDVQVTA